MHNTLNIQKADSLRLFLVICGNVKQMLKFKNTLVYYKNSCIFVKEIITKNKIS